MGGPQPLPCESSAWRVLPPTQNTLDTEGLGSESSLLSPGLLPDFAKRNTAPCADASHLGLLSRPGPGPGRGASLTCRGPLHAAGMEDGGLASRPPCGMPKVSLTQLARDHGDTKDRSRSRTGANGAGEPWHGRAGSSAAPGFADPAPDARQGAPRPVRGLVFLLWLNEARLPSSGCG